MATTGPPLARHILVPIDGSADSHPALQHGLRFALASQADLTALHVAGEPGADVLPLAATMGQWLAQRRILKAPDEWQRQLLDAHGINVQVQTVVVPAVQPAILEAIASLRPTVDFLVLATHGREGWSRWTSPSQSEPVARDAKLVTLFLRQGCRSLVTSDTGQVDLRRILVPVVEQPSPRRAMQAAGRVITLFQPRRAPEGVLFHVGTQADLLNIDLPATAGIHWSKMTKTGEPVSQILQLAREIQAQLILMMTTGHNSFADALRGSITEQVVRQAPCPVLTIPAQSQL